MALADAFAEAQVAASEDRYEDVITILTAALERGNLDDGEKAIAHGNRGIALSLVHSYPEALEDLQRAIELDPEHQLSLNHLGILAEHVYLDFEAAAHWYDKAARLGYPASAVNLGNLYRRGQGVEKDSAKAVQLFAQAARNNYSSALVSLGAMYLNGEGVERDYDQALELLRQGVSEGVTSGHFYLGRAYEEGLGVDRSDSVAFDHYRLAAVQGFAPAQGALGYLYRRGLGVEKNFVEAARWLRLAAEQGDSIAANRLAWLLATCPIQEVCNGRAAIEFATLAVNAERSATNLDTLAAAHARVGEFDAALAIIEEILTLKNLSDTAREKFARRIAWYRNGIPFQI